MKDHPGKTEKKRRKGKKKKGKKGREKKEYRNRRRYGVLTSNRQKEKRSDKGKLSRHFLSARGI